MSNLHFFKVFMIFTGLETACYILTFLLQNWNIKKDNMYYWIIAHSGFAWIASQIAIS